MEIKQTPAVVFPKIVESAPMELSKDEGKAENRQLQSEAQQTITKEMLENRVDGLNDLLQPTTRAVKFQLHEQLNEYYVQLIDPTTNEVIREIPNKKFLDMYASMAEFLGLIVDEKR